VSIGLIVAAFKSVFEYEGYEPGDARAELIVRTGADPIPGPIPRHAQLEDLQKLGFEILNPDPNGRSVRRNDYIN
jgi:hypothetical protein